MQIYTSRNLPNQKQSNCRKLKNTLAPTLSVLKGRHGFSLIEILVALFLTALLFGLVSTSNFTTRQKADEVISNLERAIRFSLNEATIRNVIIRLHINLEKEPQEYTVEYGPSDNFVIPVSKVKPSAVLSLKEEEQLKAETQALNKKFNSVSELSDKPLKLGTGLRLIAVGTSKDQTWHNEYSASIYFYPSGQKDNAIIFLGTEDEVISLALDTFTLDLVRDYRLLPEGNADDLAERQNNLSKEMFEEWIK